MKLNNVYIAEILSTITYLFHTYTHTTLNKAVFKLYFYGICDVECIVKMVYSLPHFMVICVCKAKMHEC